MFQAVFTVNRLLGSLLTIIATSDAASELGAIVGGMDVLLDTTAAIAAHTQEPHPTSYHTNKSLLKSSVNAI